MPKTKSKIKRLPRPGDYIRILPSCKSFYEKGKPNRHIVVEAGYYNGICFATPYFSWVELRDCVYAGRASDKDYIAACSKS